MHEERALEFGAVGLQPQVVLHLQTHSGTTTAIRFVVDSGASMTMIGLDLAASWGVPLPPPEAETTLNLGTASGTQPVSVRPGRLRLWWHAGRPGYSFDWPVLFRVGLSLTVPPLLGLGGIVSTCDWSFTGRYDPDTPFGHVLLDDLR